MLRSDAAHGLTRLEVGANIRSDRRFSACQVLLAEITALCLFIGVHEVRIRRSASLLQPIDCGSLQIPD